MTTGNSSEENSLAILDDLREISANEQSLHLLAEVFFVYLTHELEIDPPSPERLRHIRELYYDVFRMMEIVRDLKAGT